MKSRMFGLDLFRIFLAVTILWFHMNIHFGYTFGIFTKYVGHGSCVMTAFFMLSGYLLYLQNVKKNGGGWSVEGVKSFYMRRIATIVPLYFFVMLMHILFWNRESVKQTLFLLPIEVQGIQSLYHSLFDYQTNGGTWFISCILICYLCYPAIDWLVRRLSLKDLKIVSAILVFNLIWAPIVVRKFHIESIYSNPDFRLMEFVVGVILARIYVQYKDSEFVLRWLGKWKAFVLEMVVLLVVGFRFGLPIFALLLITLSIIRCDLLERNCVVLYGSKISYAFFLAQFFLYPIIRYFDIYPNNFGNVVCHIIAFSLCTVIAILLYEFVQKPCQKIIGNC